MESNVSSSLYVNNANYTVLLNNVRNVGELLFFTELFVVCKMWR